MTIRKLRLQHFRNYKTGKFEFDTPLTVIIGSNTTGKTNIMEALFMLATGKSFRADKSDELVYWGAELAHVQADVNRADERYTLEMLITLGQVNSQKAPRRKYMVNGISRRLFNFAGILSIVLFWPEDLQLILGSPSRRRKHLDTVLIQTDSEYRRSLLSYEKGVRQRNKVLERIREDKAEKSQLVYWDHLLIKTGAYISRKREEMVNFVNSCERPFGNFRLEYDASPISEARLAQYGRAEVAAAKTLVGPHRDDINFLDGKRNLAKFGSRGEQRLAILWLKQSERDYIEEITKHKPLLLLDDIFSELDHGHRQEVVSIVGKQQTIVTSADRHLLPDELMKAAKVIELE